MFEGVNPAMGESLGIFRRGTPEDIDAAAATTDEAYEERRKLFHVNRVGYLWDIYHKLRDRIEELAEIVTKRCGKGISGSRTGVIEVYHMVE